ADSLRGTSVSITSNAGSINSFAANPVQAAAQLSLDAWTGINLNTLAANLQAVNHFSGDISINQAAAPAQPLNVNASGVVNQVSGGTVTIRNLGSGITVAGGSAVNSNN